LQQLVLIPRNMSRAGVL